MKVNQVAHGFFGGLLGMAFSTPLFVHWSWLETLKFRKKHPISSFQFYLSLSVIFGMAVIIGLLNPLISAGIFAYRCYQENSLEPLVRMISESYQPHPKASTEMKIGRGILLGYTIISTLMSFTLLNLATGGVFGIMGVPGLAIASAFGLGGTSLLGMVFFTLGISLLGGLTGALTVGAIEVCSGHQSSAQPVSLPEDESEPYVRLLSEETTSHSNANVVNNFLPGWENFWGNPTQPEREMEVMEDIIYFDPPNGSVPTTQKSDQGMSI